MTPRKLTVAPIAVAVATAIGQVRYEGDPCDDETQHTRQREFYQAPSSEATYLSCAYDPDQRPDSRGGDHGAEGPGTPEAQLAEYGPPTLRGAIMARLVPSTISKRERITGSRKT
jgi:hypothetical protein